MKYCIIRRVPFKTPGPKSRIVWGHVLAEGEGLVLLLIPKPHMDQPHSVFIAQENLTERIFEAVSPYRLDLATEDLRGAGDRLRMLGQSFMEEEWVRNHFPPDEFP